MSTSRILEKLLPRTVGAKFEKSAALFLNRNGLSKLQQNYRCRRGEIDLIMEHGDTVVFVEVRYRARSDYGDPLETITQAKQRRIILAATKFLADHPKYQDRPCRFDAIGVNKTPAGIKYDWIKDAFST